MSSVVITLARVCISLVVRSPPPLLALLVPNWTSSLVCQRTVLITSSKSCFNSVSTMSEKRRLDASEEAANAASELPFPNGQPDDECSSEPPSKKEKHAGARKKFAFLLSYDGRDYFGMQRNTGWKTIEEEFLAAMLKAGYIDEDAYKTPQNAWFQRAARTDKGVSAVRQVVSIRMGEKINFLLASSVLENFLIPEMFLEGFTADGE